jgi:hypothetical protein
MSALFAIAIAIAIAIASLCRLPKWETAASRSEFVC